HGVRVRDHGHDTAVAAEAPPGVKEDHDAAAVQMGDPGEVEDERPGGTFRELVHNRAERGGGRQVDLSRRAHHGNPLDLLDRYLESLLLHGVLLSVRRRESRPPWPISGESECAPKLLLRGKDTEFLVR